MNKKYIRRKPLVNRPNHVSVRVSDEMLIDIQHIMQLEAHKTQTQAVLEILEEGIKRYYINRLRNGQEVVMPSYMQIVEQDGGSLLAGLNEEINNG